MPDPRRRSGCLRLANPVVPVSCRAGRLGRSRSIERVTEAIGPHLRHSFVCRAHYIACRKVHGKPVPCTGKSPSVASRNSGGAAAGANGRTVHREIGVQNRRARTEQEAEADGKV